MTNEELCLLAQDGNAKALSSLLECILPSIRLTAGKMQKHFPLLSVDTDDLVQEAMLGILKAIQAFQQEKDTLFLTFASSVANHTMLDYIRKCKTAVPESGPFLDIDAAPAGTDFDYMTYADIIFDPFALTPEEIFIKKETLAEVRNALQKVSDRERMYLHYRYGFIDDVEHSRKNTAYHFHLSESRAKKLEEEALRSCRRNLPEKYFS